MSKNRLDLDFTLETNEKRSAFLAEYLQRNEFIQRPPSEDELETMANYVLWGRDATSGKNAVQDKLIQIATKHGTWDGANDTESLEALMESPTFNEASVRSAETPWKVCRETFSREKVLNETSGQLNELFKELFGRIDWLDLCINCYDLKHGRRTKPIREQLISKFSNEEIEKAQEVVSHWNSYKYLKQRHALVELRREQFTLRDSVKTPIMRHSSTPVVEEPTIDWDADISVLPLGLKNKQSELIFKSAEQLIPSSYSEEQLKQISRYYWTKKNEKNNEKDLSFSFTDVECVYNLFLQFFDMEDDAAASKFDNNSNDLLATLNYYVEFAELSKIHSEILERKMSKEKNQDIADFINEKYGKNYTANYISTIFRQKIIPQINHAAAEHEKIVGLLFFEEEFKTCVGCGRTYLRNADYFVRKARSKDGLSNKCKFCDKRERQEKKVIQLVKREEK